MAESKVQDLKVIQNSQELRENQDVQRTKSARQTNPIVRKLLLFGKSEYTHKFSVKDLFLR